jgi:TRAP-type C4-dicarboxylate transport system substrate-binding protein
MKTGTRRGLLKAAGAVAVTAGTNMLPSHAARAAVPAYTGTTYITTTYACIWPPIEGFVAQLKKTPDLMTIDFFDSGTLMNADQQLPALRARTIQFMVQTSSYVTKAFPILGILDLPGICNQLYQHPERLAIESPLWKLMNDTLATSNVFIPSFGSGVLEPETIWSINKKITSLTDLKGLRMRVASFEAEEVMNTYGVGSVRITSDEVYLALQRGTIDAAMLNLSTLMSRKIDELVKYRFDLRGTSVSNPIFFLKDTWDGMPDKIRAAFWDAAKWYDRNWVPITQKAYNEIYYPRLKQIAVETSEPTDAEKADFLQRSRHGWDEWKARVGVDIGQKAIDLATGA